MLSSQPLSSIGSNCPVSQLQLLVPNAWVCIMIPVSLWRPVYQINQMCTDSQLKDELSVPVPMRALVSAHLQRSPGKGSSP